MICVLTTPPRCVTMCDMEDTIDQAARRTAINLMRLLETLERRDAEHYSQAKTPVGTSHRKARRRQIGLFYRQWHRDRA